MMVTGWSSVNSFDGLNSIHLRFTGTETKVLNLSSYNYLGFAESDGPCARDAKEAVKHYGVASCSPRLEVGKDEF